MKILLAGKTGQLGFELQRALAPLGEVTTVGRSECDFGDEEAVARLVQLVRPQVVVNAVAYTAVDRAEADQPTAFAVNAGAPAALAREAARLDALLVHFSTDYVFDGVREGRYTEDDVPNPQNAYGRSKLEGEVAIRQATDRHLILRTSWVVGSHGGNFAKTMLRLAAEREELRVVADQHGAPTSAALLADLTAHLVRQHQREQNVGFPYGTYHVCAAGETNWCDYARFVISEALALGQPLLATTDKIHPLKTSEYPTPAKRPTNSRLDTRRFEQTFGLRLPDWQDGVRHVLHQILERK